ETAPNVAALEVNAVRRGNHERPTRAPCTDDFRVINTCLALRQRAAVEVAGVQPELEPADERDRHPRGRAVDLDGSENAERNRLAQPVIEAEGDQVRALPAQRRDDFRLHAALRRQTWSR